MQSLSNLVSNVSNFLPWNATRVPEGIKSVQDFDASRFDDKWYEIARLDTPFERNLDNVSATYDLRRDGGIDVLNKGTNAKTGKISQIKGKAYFVGNKDQGHLKVSFFGPLYASYVVFGLDRGKDNEKYQNAFVTGNSKNFLWLLSRDPAVSDSVKSKFLQQANELGYKTDALVWVDQSQNQPNSKLSFADEGQSSEDNAKGGGTSYQYDSALTPA